MKSKYWLLALLIANVHAEQRPLPPVIENSSFPGQTVNARGTFSNNALYEVLGRLEQLQKEIQQLRGDVEEQAQVIDELKSRQGKIYKDLDERIQALSPSIQNDGMQAQLSDTEGYQDAPSKKAEDTEQSTAGSKTLGIQPAVSVTEKQLYQEAYETLRNGHNSQAIAAFKSLIDRFPAGEYADNAQYWLGEAYKVNQNMDAAKMAFSKVVELYPQSPKVPDALLKIGYIEVEKNNFAQARDVLTRVTVNYPGTTAAHLAAKKLQQIDQP